MHERHSEFSVVMPAGAPDRVIGLREILAMLYSRRAAALIIFVVVFATIAGVTFYMPKVYLGKAKLLLQKGRAETIISPTEENNTVVKPDVNEQTLNSEIEIVKSTVLLREVVETFGLHQGILRQGKATGAEAAIEMAIGGLKKRLGVRAIPKSSVILVQYESEDPVMAALLVNKVCSLYVERHLEVRESRGIFAFYQRQAEMLSDSLQTLKAQLQAYEKEFGLIDSQHQRELALKQLSEYEKELETNRATILELQQKVAFLSKHLQTEPGRVQRQIRDVQNSILQAMHNELDSLETEYEKLMAISEGAGEAERQRRMYRARTVKARIAQIEETIIAGEHAPSQELASDITHSVKFLSEDLTKARSQLVGLQARQGTLIRATNALRERLEKLERASLTHEALKRKYEIAQNNYFHYVKKQEEARLAEALDREKVANVSILDAATVPVLPVRPNVKMNLALGFALSVVLALGGALMLAYFDGVIRNRADVARMVDIPILTTISDNYWMASMLNSENFNFSDEEDELKAQLKMLDIPIIGEFTEHNGNPPDDPVPED